MKKNLIIALIIILVLAAAYLLLRREEAGLPAESPASGAEELSASDEVPAIEQELEATQTEDLDKEFADIEAEINASLEE